MAMDLPSAGTPRVVRARLPQGGGSQPHLEATGPPVCQFATKRVLADTQGQGVSLNMPGLRTPVPLGAQQRRSPANLCTTGVTVDRVPGLPGSWSSTNHLQTAAGNGGSRPEANSRPDVPDDYFAMGGEGSLAAAAGHNRCGSSSNQHPVIPTPVRSSRSNTHCPTSDFREVAVQVNRSSLLQSVESEADAGFIREHDDANLVSESFQGSATTRVHHRLASIIANSGRPNMEENEGQHVDALYTSLLRAHKRTLQDLQYPDLSTQRHRKSSSAKKSPLFHRPGSVWQSTAALVQDLSSAIAEELADLDVAWGVRDQACESRPENVAARCLRSLAKRAERSCIMQTLVPSSKSRLSLGTPMDDTAHLESRCRQLEQELAAADVRISGVIEAETIWNEVGVDAQVLQDKLASVGMEKPSTSKTQLIASNVKSQQDFTALRLGAVKQWLVDLSEQLEEKHHQLEERLQQAPALNAGHATHPKVSAMAALSRLR